MDDEISDAINHIYMAAADTTAWPRALRKIGALFGDSIAVINHQDFARDDLCWAVHHEFDSEAVRLHYEVFNTPETNPGLKALLTAKPLEPFTVSSFLESSEYYRDASVNAVLLPQDIHHGLINVVDKQAVNTSFMLYRNRSNGDYGDHDAQICRVLGLHVRNAARLARSNILTSLRQSHLDQAVGDHRVGIVLVAGSGKVIDADNFGRAMLEAGGALSERNGLRLLASLRSTSGEDVLSFLCHGEAFAPFVVRDTQHTFLVMKKLPWPYLDTVVHFPTRPIGLAVRRVDFSKAAIGDSAEIFGLTDGERAVCEQLCLGLSQSLIADRLGISQNTVKTHLRSVFSKVGVNRQSELVSRLIKLAE